MTARLQRLLILVGFGISAAWAGICLWFDHAAWSGAGALILFALYPLALAAELTASAVVGRQDGRRTCSPSAGFRSRVRAWTGEVVAGLVVFGWQQPFRANAQPDHLGDSVYGQRGVVLLHGLVCNRGFWNPWMKRLRALGHVAFMAVDLEPVFASIDDYLGTLEAAVVKITAATGLAPVLVGHSMGGLVARRWLADQHGDARVHRVITIGTPHGGTWLARFAHSPNAREMAIGSAWLNCLTQLDLPERAALFTCYYSDCDNIVFPASNATLPGADNRLLGSVAHVELAFRPEVIEALLRSL